MKFGVREICDVVLKAKSNQWVGNKYFYKNEPVIYFDTLKTSSMEGAATTVYAQGGRGNSRLVAWEGERTVTFTMEDALISPEGFMILSGAGLIQGSDAENGRKIKVHTTERTDKTRLVGDTFEIYVKELPYDEDNEEHFIYIMPLDDHGEVFTEPYCEHVTASLTQEGTGDYVGLYKITLDLADQTTVNEFATGKVVLVDYYTPKGESAMQIDITPDQFGGFYYLEASTLFRNQDGKDMPAEFVIPKCKIQSNFTFTMASSGDPSTFTFTIDAFPDYTRFDETKKVFAAIQIISSELAGNNKTRTRTIHKNVDVNDTDHIDDYELYGEGGESEATEGTQSETGLKINISLSNDSKYSFRASGDHIYVTPKAGTTSTDAAPNVLFTVALGNGEEISNTSAGGAVDGNNSNIYVVALPSSVGEPGKNVAVVVGTKTRAYHVILTKAPSA